MPAAMSDDEITYGPKKFGQRDLMVTSGLVLAGVFMIWIGISDQALGGFFSYRSSKSFGVGVLDAKGKLDSIQAPITGENISGSLRKDNKFVINFLALLNVDPTVLLNDLNQVRANALANNDAP